MSSWTHLLAEVLHEINTPVSFIDSKIVPVNPYILYLSNVIEIYPKYFPEFAA